MGNLLPINRRVEGDEKCNTNEMEIAIIPRTS